MLRFCRLYLKYLRTLADKTELGRLTAPSLLRLVDEAMKISSSRSYFNGRMSSEIWDNLDQMLEVRVNTVEYNYNLVQDHKVLCWLYVAQRGSSAFSNPQRFGCFLVMDPNNPTSVNSALRYWGCTIQAGAQVSGAFGITSRQQNLEPLERAMKGFSPLPSAFISSLSMDSPIDWSRVLLDTVNEDARHLLTLQSSQCSNVTSSVEFDIKRKSVTLFMPGFDKSEIKLYQVICFCSYIIKFIFNHDLDNASFQFKRNEVDVIVLGIKIKSNTVWSQLSSHHYACSLCYYCYFLTWTLWWWEECLIVLVNFLVDKLSNLQLNKWWNYFLILNCSHFLKHQIALFSIFFFF